MPITGTQVESLALPERLPLGQAVDNYSAFTYDPVQPDEYGNRWLAGVTFVPHGVGTSVLVQTEDPCVQLINSFAVMQGFGNPVTFLPFRIDNAITCSDLGGFTQTQLENWILEETRSIESYDLARQVWGTGGPNPTLRSTADDVTTGADQTPVGALAAVLSGMSRRLKGGRGLIHMAPAMLARLDSAGVVHQRGDRLETVTGHRIIADDGYDGSGPSGLNLGESWIYGSGPVYAKLSPPDAPGEWWESFNEVHNDFVAQVSRYGIYVFEPDFVVGAAATVATTNA